MTRPIAPPLLALLSLPLVACAPPQGPDVTRLIEPSVITATDITPPPSDPDICWGHEPPGDITTIKTQTVLAEEAQSDADGVEITPAIYREVTAPETTPDGDGRWFTRVCDAQITQAFVGSLQRALAVRGLYEGDVTGLMDAQTRTAIRTYQAAQGLNSDLLSVAAGEQLGLVALQFDRPADALALEEVALDEVTLDEVTSEDVISDELAEGDLAAEDLPPSETPRRKPET